MTRPFLFFLALALILGGSIGGAFAGGVALGKTQSEESVTSGLAATVGGASQLSQDGLGLPQRDQPLQGNQSGDFAGADLAQLRERFASGDLSQEELERLRERFRSAGLGQQDPGQAPSQDLSQEPGRLQGGAPGGAGARGFPGRTGAIEQVEGNILTLGTEEGTIQASIGADTTIRRFTEATLADLAEGMRITLIGEPGEDGTVQAVSIMVVPDDQDGFFGGGLRPRDRRQRDGISGGDGRFPGGDRP